MSPPKWWYLCCHQPGISAQVRPGVAELLEVPRAGVVRDLPAERVEVLDLEVLERRVHPVADLLGVDHEQPRGGARGDASLGAGDGVDERLGAVLHAAADERGVGLPGGVDHVGEPVVACELDVGVREERVPGGALAQPAVEPVGMGPTVRCDLQLEPALRLEPLQHPQRAVGRAAVADHEREVVAGELPHRADAELGDACGVEVRDVGGDRALAHVDLPGAGRATSARSPRHGPGDRAVVGGPGDREPPLAAAQRRLVDHGRGGRGPRPRAASTPPGSTGRGTRAWRRRSASPGRTAGTRAGCGRGRGGRSCTAARTR